ncbi:MAG: RDD family protein [Rhodospirillales bacterium]|nr:RDD family protein [Rhodospirillales bacterium]MDE1882980.1 RDD family protein [Rhodospirillales bacterium]MDE2458482.1 RDD family protein [Rhodospirillales bacterium]
MSQTAFYPPPQPDHALSHGVISRRCAAFVLDMIGIALFFWAMAIAIAIFGVLTLGLGWMAFHVLPWLPLLYYTLLIGGTGATPGQRLAGLAVRQDAMLEHPTIAQAFVWTLLLWLSFVLAGLPFLLAFVNPRHRTAHDMLSGLTLVRTTQFRY